MDEEEKKLGDEKRTIFYSFVINAIVFNQTRTCMCTPCCFLSGFDSEISYKLMLDETTKVS